MAKKTKPQEIKAAKLSSFLERHTNKPVHVTIKKKDLHLDIQGEIHRHDHQFWITKGNAKTVIEMTPSGGVFSRLINWPDKNYRVSVSIILSGETVATLTIPMRSNEKLPCQIEEAK